MSRAFAVVLDELAAERGDGAERLAAGLERAMRRLLALSAGHGDAASYLNFVLTDGVSAVATRFTSEPDYDGETLYVHAGRRYVCRDGVCYMVEADAAGGPTTIISSERLSDDDGWSVVPKNTLVLVHPTGVVTTRPIELAS